MPSLARGVLALVSVNCGEPIGVAGMLQYGSPERPCGEGLLSVQA